jgi:hypothetical protein
MRSTRERVRRSDGGAIAQLGERVLCKHEVVGSIPSGSTRRSVVRRSSRGARVAPDGWGSIPSGSTRRSAVGRSQSEAGTRGRQQKSDDRDQKVILVIWLWRESAEVRLLI